MGKMGYAKAGRPPYQPTPEHARQVETMTGFGIRQHDIATALELTARTMRKYYKRELDTGAIKANARVAQALYKNAVQNENVTAQIWWTKTRMGWKEPRDAFIDGDGNMHITIVTGVPRPDDQPQAVTDETPFTIEYTPEEEV